MKEDTLKNDLQGNNKYRLKNPSLKDGALKNKSGFADDAIQAIDNTVGTSYQAATTAASDSANQIFNMASGNAKKAYAFITKYKYQTLGVISVAGLAGASYMWLNRKSALPSMKTVKSAKAVKTAKKATKKLKK